MKQRKKEKLLVSNIVDNPLLTYPYYYILSAYMFKNEMLHAAICALHTLDFSYYRTPLHFDDIFNTLDSGAFPIYKENYIVGYFGNKMMFLESHGWRGMPATRDVFNLDNWLVC